MSRGNINIPLTPEMIEVFKSAILEGWGPGVAAAKAGITLHRSQKYRRDYPEYNELHQKHFMKRKKDKNESR